MVLDCGLKVLGEFAYDAQFKGHLLCNAPLQTGLHLCLQCPYAQLIWSQILAWEQIILPPTLHQK
jgi:hypothetical protein